MKVDRLVSILMVLLEKRRVSAQELAETFEVSIRTIYRDIDAICMAGIPISATSGVGGGFEIMPGFKLDKNVFSTNDLSALLMGLSSLSNVVQNNELVHTLAKIKNFIPAEHATAIEMKANQIYIDIHPWMSNPYMKECLEIIKKALAQRHTISFLYIDHQGNQLQRTVEPYQLVSKNGHWYLYGYCYLRNDYRLFKLSRMIGAKMCEEFYTPKDFPKPRLNIDDIASTLQITITLRIHKSIMERVLDYCPFEQFMSDGDSHYIVSFPFIDRDYYYDMLLILGDKCECLEPAYIREKLQEKIKKLSAIYQ